jgi:ribosomal protein L35AE/L33A
MNCDYTKYTIGDLVILKDICWDRQLKCKGIVGTIIDLTKHGDSGVGILVRFESDFLPPLFKNRYILPDYVYKHYPVLKV